MMARFNYEMTNRVCFGGSGGGGGGGSRSQTRRGDPFPTVTVAKSGRTPTTVTNVWTHMGTNAYKSTSISLGLSTNDGPTASVTFTPNCSSCHSPSDPFSRQ